MKIFKSIFITLVSALVLTACSNQSVNNAFNSPPSQQPTAGESSTKSTGDIQKDLEAVERELQNLDIETDFPDLLTSDFQ
jgi:peptidoglycan hydrolase CwlO-like protein